MSKEIVKVPDIGGATDVDVIEVSIAVGDSLTEEQTIVVLETDKASMEIPCPVAGTVVAVLVNEGDKVDEGSDLIEIENAAASAEEQGELAIEAPQETAAEPVVKETAPELIVADAAEKALLPVAIPDIGGTTDVDVIEVSVSVGFEVHEGDSLIVLETDKASMEIPAPASGVVSELTVAEGGKVNEGDIILTLEVATDNAASAQSAETPSNPPAATPTKIAEPAAQVAKTVAPVASSVANDDSSIHAGPAVRKIAREFGVKLSQVTGSGPKGRIIKEDIQDFVKNALTQPAASGGGALPQVPAVDFAKFGPITEEPLSKIAKVTAENMQRSWLNVPHVTQHDEVDITELEDFRKAIKEEAAQRDVKVTPLSFILKACAVALRAHPKLCSSLSADGNSLVYKDYVHIGMAVDTPAGLVVPVLRDVDKKSIYEISTDVAELAAKAKNRKLMPADMQGACFTVSSLGGLGGTGFTPIVNTPEVAILGVAKLATKPVWNGSDFVPRKMMPLSLSYDHRVVNGADGGRFMATVNSLLNDVRRLSL